MSDYSEEHLVAEATEVLGGGEPVLAAGAFGLQNLLIPMAVGNVAGGVAGDVVGGQAAGMAGLVLGGIAAKKAAAEAQGATVQLIIAVTAEKIHVLNRDTGGRLPDVLAAFDRATCEVTVKKMGLSRIIDLGNPATNEHLQLTGTTMPLSALAKGDKVVLALLSA